MPALVSTFHLKKNKIDLVMSSSEGLRTTLFHRSRQEPVIFREHQVFYLCTEQSGAGYGEPAFTLV